MLRVRTLCLVTIGSFVSCAGSAMSETAVSLRPMFVDGTADRYYFRSYLMRATSPDGRPVKPVRVLQEATLERTLVERHEQGATYELRYTRIKNRSSLPSMTNDSAELEFDTADHLPEQGGTWRDGLAFRDLIGKPFRVRVDELGNIVEVVGAEDAVLESRELASGARKLVSDDFVRRNLEPIFNIAHDGTAVGEDDSWMRTGSITADPIGAFRIDERYTLTDLGEGLATIDLSGLLFLVPSKDPDMPAVELRRGEITGQHVWDVHSAALQRSESELIIILGIENGPDKTAVMRTETERELRRIAPGEAVGWVIGDDEQKDDQQPGEEQAPEQPGNPDARADDAVDASGASDTDRPASASR